MLIHFHNMKPPILPHLVTNPIQHGLTITLYQYKSYHQAKQTKIQHAIQSTNKNDKKKGNAI